MTSLRRFLPSGAPSGLACAVCFGKWDNPDAPRAFLIGGVILVGFVFLLLAGLVLAARRIEASRKP